MAPLGSRAHPGPVMAGWDTLLDQAWLSSPRGASGKDVIGSPVRTPRNEKGEVIQRRVLRTQTTDVHCRALSSQRESHVQNYTAAMECVLE